MAAMLSSEGEALAIDDGGAIFSAEALYLLGTRNEMRGDAFSFAAAAAQRQAPPQIWFSDRAGTCDELTIFSSRPWRADFAASFLERELTGLAQARESGDPIVPLQVNTFAGDERGAPGGLERLASLAYDTVEVEVGFIDVAVAGDDVRGRIGARPDVAAMLARPIANAIVIAFGGRAGEAPEPDFVLEMRRAETIATALGAAIARRGESIATDVFGTLYDTEELLALALRRCGKSASWAARVASAALEVA
jgi:hypothetical protein